MTEPIERLAKERDYGAPVLTETFVDSGYSCLVLLIPFVLLLVGLGALIGGDSWTTRGIGIGLLALIPVAAGLLWRLYSRAYDRAATLHCFERGFVLAGKRRTVAYAWRDVEASERTETRLIGQGQTPQRFRFLEIRAKETGELVIKLGPGYNQQKILELLTAP